MRCFSYRSELQGDYVIMNYINNSPALSLQNATDSPGISIVLGIPDASTEEIYDFLGHFHVPEGAPPLCLALESSWRELIRYTGVYPWKLTHVKIHYGFLELEFCDQSAPCYKECRQRLVLQSEDLPSDFEPMKLRFEVKAGETLGMSVTDLVFGPRETSITEYSDRLSRVISFIGYPGKVNKKDIHDVVITEKTW